MSIHPRQESSGRGVRLTRQAWKGYLRGMESAHETPQPPLDVVRQPAYEFSAEDRAHAAEIRRLQKGNGITPAKVRLIARRHTPKAIRTLVDLMQGKGYQLRKNPNAGKFDDKGRKGPNYLRVPLEVQAFTRMAAATELMKLGGVYPDPTVRVTIDDSAANLALTRIVLPKEASEALAAYWLQAARLAAGQDSEIPDEDALEGEFSEDDEGLHLLPAGESAEEGAPETETASQDSPGGSLPVSDDPPQPAT